MNIDALISDRIKGIQPSPIRRFFDLANAMEGTVSLGIGEPDFVTPWHIRDAAMASLRAGETAYTPNAGTPQLRKAIAEQLYLFDEVKDCYLMSGAYDLMLIVEGKNIRSVSRFVSERLSILDNVQSCATHFILKRYKSDGVVFEKQPEDKRMVVSP